jgi:hypothetical protein
MKMVKSLLLGTAAGLVAIAGAQAADLPVKAKPVQYVKICSLYGAGFYYIPGTDTCLKVGGWIRQYLGVGTNNNMTNGPLGTSDTRARTNNDGWAWKVRGYITADARTQTEYGTLRGYIGVGGSFQGAAAGSGTVASGQASTPFGQDANNAGFSMNRGFIQLAGFTFGVTQSFYDLYPTPALSYFGGMINPSSDTSDAGQTVTAYTAQFGGGFSATISAEAPRTTTVVGSSPTALNSWSTTAGFQSNQAIAVRYPDLVGNLRLDGPWGAAQIMGVIHDASGLYYGTNTSTGHPGDATGWDIGAGIKLNANQIGPGDYFSAQINYAQGASGYPIDGAANSTLVAVPGPAGYYSAWTGSTYGMGVVSDGVFAAGGAIQLTSTWGVNAAYEHHWNQKWQTSIYGAYTATTYNAVANATLCAMEGAAQPSLAGTCNNNWSYWDIGSRTQLNIDSQTYVGIDIIYTQLNTANGGATGTFGAGAQPSVARVISNQSAWIGEFRMHRNFYP